MKSDSKKQISEKQLTAIRAKREELKALSQPFKEAVKSGTIATINEGLVRMYAEQGHGTLKTIRQWNSDGFRVKRGEHALLLWGRPAQRQRQEAEEDKDEAKDESDFFPVCFVFSEKQVERRA